jgi:hypothetical protein
LLFEPDKKLCLSGRCGSCANCVNDAWSRTWKQLTSADREWVIEQYKIMGLGDHAARYHAGPALIRYYLR